MGECHGCKSAILFTVRFGGRRSPIEAKYSAVLSCRSRFFGVTATPSYGGIAVPVLLSLLFALATSSGTKLF